MAGRQGEDAKEHAFEACKGYNGSRKGWVFKTGTLGLGYYKEGVAEPRILQLHKMLWPSCEPIVICLDEVIGIRKTIGDPAAATM